MSKKIERKNEMVYNPNKKRFYFNLSFAEELMIAIEDESRENALNKITNSIKELFSRTKDCASVFNISVENQNDKCSGETFHEEISSKGDDVYYQRIKGDSSIAILVNGKEDEGNALNHAEIYDINNNRLSDILVEYEYDENEDEFDEDFDDEEDELEEDDFDIGEDDKDNYKEVPRNKQRISRSGYCTLRKK